MITRKCKKCGHQVPLWSAYGDGGPPIESQYFKGMTFLEDHYPNGELKTDVHSGRDGLCIGSFETDLHPLWTEEEWAFYVLSK